MLALILKLGEGKAIIEISGKDINGLLKTLRKSIIIDLEGRTWIIEPKEKTYFEAYASHFEIDCTELA
jgi:hypothetical protein